MTTTPHAAAEPATTPNAGGPEITPVGPDLVSTWLAEGTAVLIDVREDFEHAEERIEGARPLPLKTLTPERVREACGGKRPVFHCKAGPRSLQAAAIVGADGERVFVLDGGIEAWAAAGRATVRPAGRRVLPVMRQVQIVAGSLVVLGVGLGAAVSAWWLALAGFVGCGLVFAGVSGWCGMAKLLAAMPWNRTATSGTGGPSCAA